jgi:hypothetical protein
VALAIFSFHSSSRQRDRARPKTGAQRSRAMTVPIPGALFAHSLRAGRTQSLLQFLFDDDLNGAANPLPQQLFQRSFSLPSAPAISLHSVILRHPPPSGYELWLNSPDLDAFSLFHQSPDTTHSQNGIKPEAIHREERAGGKFLRTVSLPAEVEESKISAEYKDGVLMIALPKAEKAKPKQISVQVA